jgi:hypothetical protein
MQINAALRGRTQLAALPQHLEQEAGQREQGQRCDRRKRKLVQHAVGARPRACTRAPWMGGRSASGSCQPTGGCQVGGMVMTSRTARCARSTKDSGGAAFGTHLGHLGLLLGDAGLHGLLVPLLGQALQLLLVLPLVAPLLPRSSRPPYWFDTDYSFYELGSGAWGARSSTPPRSRATSSAGTTSSGRGTALALCAGV